MPLRKIAMLGHPVLRTPARELSTDALEDDATQRLIDDLVATMRDANGAGLAAPQIYESVRICTIEVCDNPRYPYKPNIPLTILVNPKLTPLSDITFDNFEGCLSVPGVRGVVPRFAEIRVDALDRRGAPLSFEVRGLTAGTYQHEVDHLDGRLFLDRVVDTTTLCTWENFDRFHKTRFAEQAKNLVARWGS